MKSLVSIQTLKSYALPAVLASVVLFSGCAAITAQNPGGKLTPVNAHAVEGNSRVMLKGHDVVAYFMQNKHAMGSAQFTSVYEGITFQFASSEHKALFDKEPAKYQPQYGGYCANGIVYGIPWGGDADSWRMIDGKLYIFGGAGSRDGFFLDTPGNIKLADKYWAEEVSGSNSFWQRTKRLTLRVPHYKSGSDLAALVAASKK
jgi:YHS domain-containing protein